MLARRQDELDAGAEHLGWKVGFGSPAAMAALAIDRPLVGYLTAGRRLAPGATVSVAGWTRGVIEAEIAAYVGPDLAVDGWGLAVELADVDHPPSDVEEILAGNVYHRHVLFGGRVAVLPEERGVSVRLDGEEVAATSDPDELVGELGWVLATTASTLAAAGNELRPGDVVITGSMIPPMEIAPGQLWEVSAPGLGSIDVRLT
jgi:2-keto-4-pentenoate hydratase